MPSDRKRKIRLIVALTAAVILATTLIYTSVGASSKYVKPSELVRDHRAGKVYKVNGKVVPGSIVRHGESMTFQLRDRDNAKSPKVTVRYRGAVPDPFRDGREVSIDVKRSGGIFQGQHDTLVTKCPSKYSASK